MRVVAVLNSYNLPGQAGGHSARIRKFAAALEEQGWRPGRDIQLQIVDTDTRRETEVAARRLAESLVDIIHAIGTPNAVAAAAATADIPIVYYGAHPEGIGEAECSAPNVTGHILTLPFTSSYKNFRFLRRLLPDVHVVWTPFYEDTIFVRDEMKALHAGARSSTGQRVWLSGESGRVGFKTLATLAYIIGVEYRELVYSNSHELHDSIAQVDPANGLLMPYNDAFYCRGAVQTLLDASLQFGVPVIWNNNPELAAKGALAGIGADFGELGRASGELAAAILAGVSPRDRPRRRDASEVTWVNLDTARRLGLEVSADVLLGATRCIEDGGRATAPDAQRH
jgi:putative ABC transport system substrate-binding protein